MNTNLVLFSPLFIYLHRFGGGSSIKIQQIQKSTAASTHSIYQEDRKWKSVINLRKELLIQHTRRSSLFKARFPLHMEDYEQKFQETGHKFSKLTCI